MDSHWSFHYSDDHHQQQQHQQLPLVNNNNQHQQQPSHNIHSMPSGSSNQLQRQLRSFWDNQCQESRHATDFKNHSLPLARIKKIMKSDDNVRMISADAPVVLARACEMFIQDLTLRSWNCTEESKRKTLQKADISAALSTSDLFDFLVDILPREKPFISTSMPPMNPGSSLGIVCDHQHLQHQQQQQQQHEGGYSLGDGAGLTMGLQMHHQLVQPDNQINQGLYDHSNSKFVHRGWPNYLSNHSAWPPPDF